MKDSSGEEIFQGKLGSVLSYSRIFNLGVKMESYVSSSTVWMTKAHYYEETS